MFFLCFDEKSIFETKTNKTRIRKKLKQNVSSFSVAQNLLLQQLMLLVDCSAKGTFKEKGSSTRRIDFWELEPFSGTSP